MRHDRIRRGVKAYCYDDRGAGATEYVGVMIVMAIMVVALLATEAGRRIGDQFVCTVESIFGKGGTCESGSGEKAADPESRGDAYYEPPLCTISTVRDKVGSKLKVGWFEWGNEYGFQTQEQQANYDVNKDGKVDENDKLILTSFNQSGEVGANWSAGGDFGDGAEAEVELSGGVKVKAGDTWVFESEDEANKFRDDLETIHNYEMRQTMPGGGEASMGDSFMAMFGKGPLVEYEDALNRVEDKLDGRNITYGSVGLYGNASGGLNVKAGSEDVLGAGIDGSVSLNGDVMTTNDEYRGTRSFTYSLEAKGTFGANASAGGVKHGENVQGTRSVQVTVTRDTKTGELSRIDFTQTTETAGGTSDSASGDNGKKGKDKRGGGVGHKDNSGESDIDIRTNTISFEPGEAGDADRQIAQDWLDGGGDSNAALEYMINFDAPTDRPGKDDPFGQLMFDEGKSSNTAYTGDSDAHEYGLELHLGVSLGATISTEHKEELLDEAEFLGAPKDGKRDYVPYSYCANG